MSFSFDPKEADKTPDATVEDVLEELNRTDPDFVGAYMTVLEPSLRMRLNIGSWPEHYRAYLVRQMHAAYNRERPAIESEGRGEFAVDEREAFALAPLRSPTYLVSREFLLNKFGWGTPAAQPPRVVARPGVPRAPPPRNITDDSADERGVTPASEWKRLPLAAPRDRTDVFWRFCADRRFPQYELWTRQSMAALARYIVSRVLLYHASGRLGKGVCTILDAGAGTGRLAHFLAVDIRERHKKLPVSINIIACDSGREKIPTQFPVVSLGYSEMLPDAKPDIVVASWMPLGEDWTADFRATQSVLEYILVGPPEATGHVEHTWGPAALPAGWTRSEIVEVARFQVCRCDSRGEIGHSTTMSFRRDLSGPEAEAACAALEAKDCGAKAFGAGDFAEAVTHYMRAVELFVEAAGEGMGEEKAAAKGSPVAFYLCQTWVNLALCAIHREAPEDARDFAKKALNVEPSNKKALYVLGKALRLLDQIEEAYKIMKSLEKEQPDNKDIQNELHLLRVEFSSRSVLNEHSDDEDDDDEEEEEEEEDENEEGEEEDENRRESEDGTVILTRKESEPIGDEYRRERYGTDTKDDVVVVIKDAPNDEEKESEPQKEDGNK